MQKIPNQQGFVPLFAENNKKTARNSGRGIDIKIIELKRRINYNLFYMFCTFVMKITTL
jgi:hypothetical protein